MSHRADTRGGFPHTLPHAERVQLRPMRSGLAAGGAVRGPPTGTSVAKPLPGQFNEKELMHGLNDRLAGFIEKVHHLEHQNHLLEREIQAIRGKAKSASCLEEEYGPELRRLRQLVQEIAHHKHQIEIEHQSLEDELSDLRRQQEQEARSRTDAERTIVVLKKDISDAYRAKLQLDRKAQALVEEIDSLKKSHEADVSEVVAQIQSAQVSVRAHDFGSPGVTAALRDIRSQLEGHAVSDVQQVEESFRAQFARLTEAAEAKREALKSTQQEIQEFRRRLQAKNIELDCARGTREALEKQLHDVEDRHKEEMIHYQNTIKELENELINCKFDMSGYLREYQDLLNVKMALDVEILSYRKLLCGEEARLSTMSDTHMSLPYIYHQSPVYTLPCFSRPGGPLRRAEPQYKFVEEIITETTREIEMSEFEETGSEGETEAGIEEPGCPKRDGRGGSEEEGGEDKDGGEDEGEQVSDAEQNQVEGEGGSPGEVDIAGEEESEEPEEAAGNGEDDENTQSQVKPGESVDDEEEKHQKVSGNTEDEEKAPSSKPDDLKPDVPLEEELLKTSDGGEKAEAEEVSFSPAQVKDPSKKSDESQEQRSVVQVQDKVHSVSSETAKKPTDSTAEAKKLLYGKTEEPLEKTQVSLSAKTKTEEKENTHAEQKEINKPEGAECEDKEAKIVQDARHESVKVPVKESSLQSDAKSLPEVKDQKPNAEDESKTIQKEKTSVSGDIKELHQGAPESSQVHKSKVCDASEKISDPQGKPEQVDSGKTER